MKKEDMLLIGGLLAAVYVLMKPLQRVGGSVADLTEQTTQVTGSVAEAASSSIGLLTNAANNISNPDSTFRQNLSGIVDFFNIKKWGSDDHWLW